MIDLILNVVGKLTFYGRLVSVIYYDTVIVNKNQLRFVTGGHNMTERLLNVYQFHVNVYEVSRYAPPY